MAVTIGIQQFANESFALLAKVKVGAANQSHDSRAYSAEHCCHPRDVHKLMEEESDAENDKEEGRIAPKQVQNGSWGSSASYSLQRH